MAEILDQEIAAASGIEAVQAVLDVICQVTGMGFAALARVTSTAWVACATRDEIGLGLAQGGTLPVDTTICQIVRQDGHAVVITDTARDARYRNHPAPRLYGFRSYIAVPVILADGEIFGTLCAIDPAPRPIDTPGIAEMMRLFAQLVAANLDSQRRNAAMEQRLVAEIGSSELREQFIAVLAHDLRNPLAAIDAGIRLLTRNPAEPRAPVIFADMKHSVRRMAELIDNVMDFARGRLGGGISLTIGPPTDIEPMLREVLGEIVQASPARHIVAEFALAESVRCDRVRIGQAFSNLLANAVTHGAPEAPVRARVTSGGGIFAITVANAGPAIPEAAMKHLFQPFLRAAVRNSRQGLGLGLFIVSEIARAHGGTIAVSSSDAETVFTFRMPSGA